MKIQVTQVDSPMGVIYVASTSKGVCSIHFADRWQIGQQRLEARFGESTQQQEGDPFQLRLRLQNYLEGAREMFDGIPLDPGGTEFQQSVWTALGRIERGETWSYAQLAAHVGKPKAVRAVGATNGRNPISIVVPCHRVIGKAGELRGYAGGLDRKRWLLELESVKLL